MLRYLRENTGNWIIKFFLGIIVIVFVFLGVGSMNAGKHNQVATVNDQAITFAEYRDAYQRMIQRLQQQFGTSLDDELIKSMNVKQYAVNSLIDQKILEIEAQKLKIVVSDEELKQDLLSAKAFQKDGVFNMDLYKRVLGQNAMTPETFEAMQRNTIRNTKLQRMVINGITVGNQEAQAWYSFNNTKAGIVSVLIDPETFSDVFADEDQIRAQYDDHHELYMSEPKRKVAFLVFAPEDFEDQVKIDETSIRDFYDQNAPRFTTPEQVEASHILIRVDESADEQVVAKAKEEALNIYKKAVNAEDFSALAKTYSQGPSAAGGGYLGRFDKTSMVKPFADAAFSMKSGDISQPVRTRFGWHIIKVTDRTPETVMPFEIAKVQIQKELASSRLQDLAYNKAEDAYDAVLDGDSFEQVALVAAKPSVNTPAFTALGAELKGLGISDPGEFANTAFSLVDNEISEVKKIGNNYYLMHVLEKIDPMLLAYEDVKNEIAVTLTTGLQKQAAKKAAELMLEKAGNGAESLVKLARDNHLKVEFSKMFTRNEAVPGITGSEVIAQAAFTLDEKNSVYKQVLEVSGKFYLIGLKEKQAPDAASIADNLDKVKLQLETRKQQDYYSQWLAARKENAEIRINTDIIN
ncbi:parvulin peptidyl-prolyl isomerase [Desulfobacter hydrogenophilus]|uniref:Periplasmic chaperone PpiD n=1 Tax=Desulfobacter hydrogenophilus TaxID=2291 RepID=A0A328FHA0_9BACT|nr:peptidylprolyl isomerase [Desulfobacter hydrogenophilus]NDY71620.1 parvulin peptidyl-prolyl isomerase [Desulfobacter hydrogenophilus]QBH15397.1 parvulin peptidyl-prolyl isomerase [Desulfobacter hydrogenophilus]RAM02473.1 parvulin peptidyl-prolyl isomerase [Desulfobacter hydrogenophilus]